MRAWKSWGPDLTLLYFLAHRTQLNTLVPENDKPFKCEKCDYICSLKCILKIHVASVQENKKQIRCEVNGYHCYQKCGKCADHVIFKVLKFWLNFESLFSVDF